MRSTIRIIILPPVGPDTVSKNQARKVTEIMSVVYRFSIDVSQPRDGTDVVREDFVWRETTDAKLKSTKTVEHSLLRTVSRANLHGEDATSDGKDGGRNGNGKGNGKAEADVLAIVRLKSAFGWKKLRSKVEPVERKAVNCTISFFFHKVSINPKLVSA
ncbi:hypothetical protein ColTof4_06255 [Colletotrichum tofieldiae]|nr:hypothetical protein ColTof3_01442 [Colletotrichum tofieldiae]GKT73832.1 hypothetical protein ColTof4_06255 [Colletotrichum tofieldiae]